MSSIQLTVNLFEKGKSRNGGYNNEQLKVLGVVNLSKGWKRTIIGQRYPEKVIERFLALKDHHLKLSGVELFKPSPPISSEKGKASSAQDVDAYKKGVTDCISILETKIGRLDKYQGNASVRVAYISLLDELKALV